MARRPLGDVGPVQARQSVAEMKIILTGGTGFIGGHLRAAAAVRGDEVLLVPRQGSQPKLRANERMACESIVQNLELSDYVLVHLAALYKPSDDAEDLDELIDVNLRFGLSVARRFRIAGGKRVVCVGTWHQLLGARPGGFPSSYAASKEAFDLVSRTPVFREGAQWTQLLLYDVVGEGDPRPKAAPAFAAAVRDGRPIRIPAEEVQVDLLHVSDVISALYMAAEQGTGGDFCVARREPTTLLELAEFVMSALGRRTEVRRDYPLRSPLTAHLVYNRPPPPNWRPGLSVPESIRRALLRPFPSPTGGTERP